MWHVCVCGVGGRGVGLREGCLDCSEITSVMGILCEKYHI